MFKIVEKKEKKISGADFQAALASYASSDAEITKINKDIDLKVIEIKQKHESQLKQLTDKQEEAQKVIKSYVDANKSKLFPGKKKSFETAYATIGFRSSVPKLELLEGFTWESVRDKLKKLMPQFIRTVEEPDKKKLLSSRDDQAVTKNFKKVGIQVVKDEAFYIKLN